MDPDFPGFPATPNLLPSSILFTYYLGLIRSPISVPETPDARAPTPRLTLAHAGSVFIVDCAEQDACKENQQLMEPPTKKRKAINDFFTPSSKSWLIDHESLVPSQRGVGGKVKQGFTPYETPVPGLTIFHNFISPIEERSILSFLDDSSRCNWRTDLSRRTMHFGGTYCLMPSKSDIPTKAKPEILQAPPMPGELEWLIERMVDAHVFPTSQRPQYCIVNEYINDLGISAHTENFQFGEPVVGLSLLSACPIRFQELTQPCDGSVRSGKAGKVEKTGKKVDVNMPGKSLIVMRGESRWKWQHEIVRSAKGRGVGWKRVSLTFRYKPEG